MLAKPFSQACENNKAPILAILQRVFTKTTCVMEIGSGTGQHAVSFAEHLPHLAWQPTDREENIPGIEQWCYESQAPNLLPPLQFDIRDEQWPTPAADAVFSANTAHIMPWPLTQLMIKKVGAHLPAGGLFALYGPFNYGGNYTSDSNARFDDWLQSVNPQQGIRHFEEMNQHAKNAGLVLQEDNPMPANNRLLVWQKQ